MKELKKGFISYRFITTHGDTLVSDVLPRTGAHSVLAWALTSLRGVGRGYRVARIERGATLHGSRYFDIVLETL